jgi:D-lactate dehydrogenase (cytochrome)
VLENYNEQVDESLEERKVRGKPWNSYHKVINNPDVVVFPRTTEEVSNIIKICNKYNISGIFNVSITYMYM